MSARDLAEALIKKSEGFYPRPYICPAGKWTIAWGHTGPDVTAGLVLSEEQGQTLLDRDLDNASQQLDHLVKVSLTDGQTAALLDFIFNLGAGALANSTLLVKLNAGDYDGAAAEFPKWDKAHINGVVVSLPGLTARRQAEVDLFNA